MVVVDFQALADLQRTFRERHEEIDAELAALSARVSEVWARYEGEAADGMHRAVDQWFGAARDMHDRLAELHNMIAVAHDNHASAVRAGVHRWQVSR